MPYILKMPIKYLIELIFEFQGAGVHDFIITAHRNPNCRYEYRFLSLNRENLVRRLIVQLGPVAIDTLNTPEKWEQMIESWVKAGTGRVGLWLQEESRFRPFLLEAFHIIIVHEAMTA